MADEFETIETSSQHVHVFVTCQIHCFVFVLFVAFILQ